MSNIDFYLLNEISLEACYNFICKLVDKAYQQKRQVYIHTNSPQETQILDDLLWIFRDDAFIPHGLYGATTTNIQIGHKDESMQQQDILINLTTEIPPFFTKFQRIIEIVPQNLRENARNKYRSYREQNCEISTHDLTQKLIK